MITEYETELSIEDILSTRNLAEDLPEDVISGIGQECKRGLEIDEATLEDWRERHDQAMDLALQVAENKDWPWEGSSNVIYPLITVGAMQFAARAYPAIVPGPQIVRARINGDDSGVFEVATDPNGQPVMGPNGQPQAQMIVPPGAKAEKAARVSKHMSYQLLEEMDNWVEDTDAMLHYLAIAGTAFRKTYYDTELNRPASRWIPGSELVVNMDASDLETAARVSEIFYLHPYQLIEKCRTGEYYCPEEKIKTMFEGHEDPEAQVCLVEQHCRIDLDGDGYPEPYVVIFKKDDGMILYVGALFAREDVLMGEDGEVMMIRASTPYTKYEFMPNPNNGFYGIGLGWLLCPLNEQINTTINQLNDAGTLQNTPMGFVAQGLHIRGGDFNFQPGEFKQVDTRGGAIRENLYQLQFQPPSNVLFSLLQLMISSGQDISSVKDIMLGDAQTNVAPTTALTLVEQGSKQFNAVFKRIHRSLSRELRKLFNINAATLDPEKYYTFLDLQERIETTDYDPDSLDVTPVTDANMAQQQQKLAQAQFLLSMTQFGNMVNVPAILEKVFEAQGIEEPQKYLVPPQPQGPTPEQQVNMMKAQTNMFEAESERLRILAENLESETRAALNIAKAEETESGIQLQQYLRQIERIKNEIQRVPGMAGPSGNATGPQGFAGAPRPPQGNVG